MHLIVITYPSSVDKEVDCIVQLFREGLESLHIRKPDFDLRQLASFLDLLPVEYHSRIVIHSHYGLLSDYNLKGIHVSEHVRDKPSLLSAALDASSTQDSSISISTSFHDLLTLEHYDQEPDPIYSYVFLSPIFDSISKRGYRSAFQFDKLQQVLSALSSQVIALGGINEENIAEASSLGFSGVAVLGSVWCQENPAASFRRIQKLCLNQRGSVNGEVDYS